MPDAGLALVSATNGTVERATRVGSDPVAVIVSADGSTAYMADSSPGDVYAVSLPDLRVRWKHHTGGAPFGLLLHGDRLYVSLFDTTQVVELDPSTGGALAGDPVPQGPAAMALDGSGRVLVAGTRGYVTRIPGSTLAAGHGFGIAVSGGATWTADYERAELVRTDETGGVHRVGMPEPLFPFWLAPGPGGTVLVAAEGASEDTGEGAVFRFDPVSETFTKLAQVRDPDQVLDSAGAVLVAAHGDREVLAIKGAAVSRWAAGVAAVALAPDPGLGLIAVAVNAHE